MQLTDVPFSFLPSSTTVLRLALPAFRSVESAYSWAWATSWVAQNTKSFADKVWSSPCFYQDKRPKQWQQGRAAGCLALLPSHLCGRKLLLVKAKWHWSDHAVGSRGWKSLKDHKGNLHYLHVHGHCMPQTVTTGQLICSKLLPSGILSMSLSPSWHYCTCMHVTQQWDISTSLNFGKTCVYFSSSVVSIKTSCLESGICLISVNAHCKINSEHA